MESLLPSNISLIKYFKWLNEPSCFQLNGDTLVVTTDNKTDFWQETWYKFRVNTGHVFGAEIQRDFTLEVCIEADFTTLYDQAGLMIYVDEKHWLKAGIEFNDGQPMIGSVLTNDVSDWATGIFKIFHFINIVIRNCSVNELGVFTGDPRKFWLRLSKVGNVVCVKYSTDKTTWHLLRLSSFPVSNNYLVGPMCCSPQRDGLVVKFSEIKFSEPAEDLLHSN